MIKQNKNGFIEPTKIYEYLKLKLSAFRRSHYWLSRIHWWDSVPLLGQLFKSVPCQQWDTSITAKKKQKKKVAAINQRRSSRYLNIEVARRLGQEKRNCKSTTSKKITNKIKNTSLLQKYGYFVGVPLLEHMQNLLIIFFCSSSGTGKCLFMASHQCPTTGEIICPDTGYRVAHYRISLFLEKNIFFSIYQIN